MKISQKCLLIRGFSNMFAQPLGPLVILHQAYNKIDGVGKGRDAEEGKTDRVPRVVFWCILGEEYKWSNNTPNCGKED